MFFPVVLLTGVARFLFTPLALAVVFAMLTSYLLSRTLVPTMASYLLPDKHQQDDGTGLWRRFLRGFEAGFERIRQHYVSALEYLHCASQPLADVRRADDRRARSRCLLVTGEDFFPTVDAGLMKFHVRAPSGTRIERTNLLSTRSSARSGR